MAKKKIDPLNKKQYGAVSVMLTVSDIPAAVSFYQKAFGFTKRGIMNGPGGKPIHAELTLRGTTLMLGPENPEMGKRSAKSVGASPAGLFIYVENVDKVLPKSGDGHVLGRSLWHHRRSKWIHVDGRHAQSRAYGEGNERENAGTDAPTAREYRQRCLNQCARVTDVRRADVSVHNHCRCW